MNIYDWKLILYVLIAYKLFNLLQKYYYSGKKISKTHKLNTKIFWIGLYLYTKNTLIIEFLKWKLLDLPKKKPLHLYGIHMFYGQYGQGKTMSMTYELNKLREKYGNQIVIATNFYYKDQDHAIEGYEQILTLSEKYRNLFLEKGIRIPLVVAYDEIQNEFTSRDYKSFPLDFLRLLTQNRKGAGVMVLGTAQHFDRVDKIIRELSLFSYDCRTYFNRLTSYKRYWTDDYIAKNQAVGEKKDKIKSMRTTWFVQTDKLRLSYDSFQFLKSANLKGSATLEDLHKLQTETIPTLSVQPPVRKKFGLHV